MVLRAPSLYTHIDIKTVIKVLVHASVMSQSHWNHFITLTELRLVFPCYKTGKYCDDYLEPLHLLFQS